MNSKTEVTIENGTWMLLWLILWVVVSWIAVVTPARRAAKDAAEDRKAAERYMMETMTARSIAVEAQEETERLVRRIK
jgi:hypothetical protein